MQGLSVPAHLAGGVGGERQERDLARPLERQGQPPLVAGTGAGDAARQDLAALGDEAPKARHLLVIDVVHPLDAKRAHLAVRALAALALSAYVDCHFLLST